jgi:peptidylprolyl isomerase
VSRPRSTRTGARRTRLAALGGVLLLSTAGLAACGEDDGSDASAAGLEAVTVEGDPGKEPEVTFEDQVSPGEVESEVITEGDGEELAEGDNAFAHIWMGNGFTQEKAFSTYDAESPELLTWADLGEPFQEAIEGHTVGSRVAVAASAEDTYGEGGNPQLGIGNKDGIVIVVDLLGKVGTEPTGEEREPAKWAPTLVEDGGTITGLDFTDANKPSKNLLDTTLVKGEGPVVEKGQTIAVDYLGQVYDAKKPFDESYSKQPTSFPIGTGAVVKGWDQALVGRAVGSRVLLSIPPDLGYGEEGNKDAGIKGTDTLYFVVDILAAG